MSQINITPMVITLDGTLGRWAASWEFGRICVRHGSGLSHGYAMGSYMGGSNGDGLGGNMYGHAASIWNKAEWEYYVA